MILLKTRIIGFTTSRNIFKFVQGVKDVQGISLYLNILEKKLSSNLKTI